MSKDRIVLPKCYNFHLHPRRGNMLRTVVPYILAQFRGGVVMGNTEPPIITAENAGDYYAEIESACESDFDSMMSIMLTQDTTPEIVEEAGKYGISVLKFIPGATSHGSDKGVHWEQIEDYYKCFEAAQKTRMVLSLHAETLRDVSGKDLKDIDREAGCIPFVSRIVNRFRDKLIIVVEHVSTADMIGYSKNCPPNVFFGLAPHHATMAYSDVCGPDGKIRNPHNFCRPIAKTWTDVTAVRRAMTSGDPRYIFGSDFAPHRESAKMKTPPAAGVCDLFSLCRLCQIFEEEDARDKLPGFLTAGEKAYWSVEPSRKTVTLIRQGQRIPDRIPVCNEPGESIVPFGAGETLPFTIAG